MSRYQQMFVQLGARNERALIPFFVLGFPNAEQCLQAIDAAIAAGADALELGIPYSDPVADGPTIVAAANTALANGMTPGIALQLVAQIRAKHPHIAIGLLLYANLVLAKGTDAFCKQAKLAGVDSLLVADIPLREAASLRQAAGCHQLEVVFIVPPNADVESTYALAKASKAYVYLLSRAGVTGSENAAAMPLAHLLKQLKEAGSVPPVLGFGISTPEQVRAAGRAGAAGVIVGSAMIECMNRGLTGVGLVRSITDYVSALKAATR